MWCEWGAQTLFDRTCPLFPWNLNNEQTHKFSDVYLITASQGTNSEFTDLVIKKTKERIKHFSWTWSKCSQKAKLAGVVCARGVHQPGKIQKLPEVLKQAFDMGQEIKSTKKSNPDLC